MDYVIELENVTVCYQELVALEDVSLKMATGESLALIGPNGSGKTTLIKTILGLVTPVAGTVRLFGKPPQQLDGEWKRVSYVPQIAQIDSRFPIRVFDVVLMGRYGQVGLIRRPGRSDREAVWRALEQVSMGDLAQRPIGRLSGGQRQRALVARALAAEPELLLLDEPFGGLSPAETDLMAKSIRRLHQGGRFGRLHSEGPAMIIVEHKLQQLMKIVDRIVVLNFGTLLAEGTPAEVVNNPQVIEAYLGQGGGQ